MDFWPKSVDFVDLIVFKDSDLIPGQNLWSFV